MFSSSTIFQLPGGSKRSPDAAWVELSRWQTLTAEQRQSLPPIAPDFVIELRSKTDDLGTLQEKMQEYMDSGVRFLPSSPPLLPIGMLGHEGDEGDLEFRLILYPAPRHALAEGMSR